MLSNFPSQVASGAYEELLEANLKSLLEAAGRHAAPATANR
jgi:hypothetical protein